MDDAAASEMFGVTLRIGHVVPVGQEDAGNSPQRLELPYERFQELRRVDQPIASSVPNEVAVAAE